MNRIKDFEMKDELIRTWSTFLPDEAGKEVSKILKSKWINTGKQEKTFREKLCKRFNFKYCVACNSGTAALKAALATIGVGPKDEVVTTPYTFIATNTSILEMGARPVFADICYNTLNINPSSIAEKINQNTKAIMVVHYGGIPCDMDEIREIGKTYNLPIIEDSAHALGSKYKEKYIGEEGDIITFSFQVVKIINTGDGGLITTTNEKYYELLKRLVWYGVDRENKITELIDPLPNDIDILGFKANMNDIVATLGIVGIDNFDLPFYRRKKIGELYRKELSDLNKVKLLHYPKYITPNYQIFPIHVTDRERFSLFMRDKSIMVNVNNRRNDRYTIFGGISSRLPETEKADQDTILVPLHADLSDKDVNRILEAIFEYDKT